MPPVSSRRSPARADPARSTSHSSRVPNCAPPTGVRVPLPDSCAGPDQPRSGRVRAAGATGARSPGLGLPDARLLRGQWCAAPVRSPPGGAAPPPRQCHHRAQTGRFSRQNLYAPERTHRWDGGRRACSAPSCDDRTPHSPRYPATGRRLRAPLPGGIERTIIVELVLMATKLAPTDIAGMMIPKERGPVLALALSGVPLDAGRFARQGPLAGLRAPRDIRPSVERIVQDREHAGVT